MRKELDQIGVAMSLVGTRRPMLLKMSRYLEPIIEGLRGSRPEVRKVREKLVRAQHNLERGPTSPLRASKNMWAARDLVDQVLKLKDKGLLDLPEEYSEGRVTLENAWGYTRDELRGFRGLFRQVIAEFADIGLYDKLAYGVIELDPEESKAQLLSYDERTDRFIANPDRGKSKTAIYAAFSGRLWDKLFISADRQSWPTRGQFVTSFVKAMRGHGLSSEDRARLQVTVGRIAGHDWQNVTT